MNRTQQRLVERAEKALAGGRFGDRVQGTERMIAELIALTKRLGEERDEYRRRWLAT